MRFKSNYKQTSVAFLQYLYDKDILTLKGKTTAKRFLMYVYIKPLIILHF